MITDLKRTFRKTSVYALGNITIKLIGLILIPLYTNVKFFTVADYGAIGILEITSQVLVAVLGLSLAQSLTRWYWDANYILKQKSIFFTSIIVLFVLSAIILLTIFPSADYFSQILFNNNQYGYIIKLMLFSTGMQVVSNQTLALAKLQEKALLFSINNVLKLTVTLGLTVYFVVYQQKKLDGIFEAQAIASLVSLLLLIPYTIRNIKIKFEVVILKDMLIFGYPLIIASISGVFFSVIDRYFLNFMKGLDDVGIYNLGFKLASTLNVVVITSMQLALSPLMMKKMNDPDNKRFYSKIMTYFSFILMISVIGISIFSLEGIKLVVKNNVYQKSVYIVALLALSSFFGMLKDQALIGLQITKKTKITGTVIVIATGINIVLNALLIPIMGIFGAALGTLISQFSFFIIIYTKSQKAYFIPYEIAKIIKVTLIGTLIIFASLALNPITGIIRIPLKLILFALFIVALFFVNFFDPVEKATVKQALLSWKSPSKLGENIKRLFNS